MNSTATSPTTSRQKCMQTDPTAGTPMIDLMTTASTPKTNRPPTKSAIQALEGATSSLPASLPPPPPLSYTSATNSSLSVPNGSQRTILPSAWHGNPTTFPNQLKHWILKLHYPRCASEDGERVSFLEQQIQQAKDTHESSLKNVIEECITLETTALQSQENDTIYSLLPALAESINTLEGSNTDVHHKVITLLYLDSTFLTHTTSTSRESQCYGAHHNLDTIPSPSIHQLTNTYTTAAQRNKRTTAPYKVPPTSGK